MAGVGEDGNERHARSLGAATPPKRGRRRQERYFVQGASIDALADATGGAVGLGA